MDKRYETRTVWRTVIEGSYVRIRGVEATRVARLFRPISRGGSYTRGEALSPDLAGWRLRAWRALSPQSRGGELRAKGLFPGACAAGRRARGYRDCAALRATRAGRSRIHAVPREGLFCAQLPEVDAVSGHFRRAWIFWRPAVAQDSSFSLPLAPPTPIAPITEEPTLSRSPPAWVL